MGRMSREGLYPLEVDPAIGFVAELTEEQQSNISKIYELFFNIIYLFLVLVFYHG